MTAPDLTFATAAWNIASGIAVGVLGLMSLRGGASRPRGALAFGLFGTVWAVQIAAASSLYLVASATAAQTLFFVYFVTLLPLPYLLLEFAAAQHADPSRTPWRVLRLVAALVALSAAGAFALEPSLVFNGLEVANGFYYANWGPLFVPLVLVPHFGAFGAAIYALHRASMRAPTSRTRVRLATLLGGLGLYAAFSAGNNFLYYLLVFALYPTEVVLADGLFVLLFGGLSVIYCAVAAVHVRRARSATVHDDRQLHALIAGALILPLVWGAVEGVTVMFAGQAVFNTVGLWRLFGVGVIAYGLARWRFYDLPQRAGTVAATASGTATAAATGAMTYGAGALVLNSAGIPAVLALIVASATLFPAFRFARRLLVGGSEAVKGPLDQQLYGQRIDSYRAALEASLARGTLEEDEPFLAALRERFTISEAEDRVLRYYARTSVIVPRSQHAWDAYDRLRLLGEGGGGRTWLARDRARDRLVVLKEPLERWQQEPAAREAVVREARLAAKVRHPHVVAVESVLEGKSSPVIVMEYLEGGSLADVLRARGAVPWREAVPLMVDILSGVEAIHAAGIVHRDIKPSNVLLTRDGVAKIADFGIAVAVAGPAASGKTQIMDAGASTIAGTMAYMAPEVRAGQSHGDRRSDVFACATLLHELIHGAPPGLGPTVLVADPAPPALAAAIARGIAEQPDARYPTARAFAEELARVTRG